MKVTFKGVYTGVWYASIGLAILTGIWKPFIVLTSIALAYNVINDSRNQTEHGVPDDDDGS